MNRGLGIQPLLDYPSLTRRWIAVTSLKPTAKAPENERFEDEPFLLGYPMFRVCAILFREHWANETAFSSAPKLYVFRLEYLSVMLLEIEIRCCPTRISDFASAILCGKCMRSIGQLEISKSLTARYLWQDWCWVLWASGPLLRIHWPRASWVTWSIHCCSWQHVSFFHQGGGCAPPESLSEPRSCNFQQGFMGLQRRQDGREWRLLGLLMNHLL